MIDVFLVHDDVDRASMIRSAIASVPDFTLISETQNGRDGTFALSTIMQGHPRVAVVRLNLGDMNGFDFINEIRSKQPDVYIIPALEGNEGGQVWQQLLQMDLRDVIVGAVGAPDIVKIFLSAAPRAQARYEECRPKGPAAGEAFVISVVSARAGVGKSVIALNLAASMAKHNNSVSLLDFSLNSGDFAVMLDDVPRNNIMDAVSSGGNIDQDLLQNLLAPHPRLGFRYLGSPNQEFDPTPFDYNVAMSIITAMRSVSQFVVIDTGAAFAGTTLAAASSCDIIFFVTCRDVARLLASQRFIKYLRNDLNVPSAKLKVLVNEAEIGAEISENEIESLLEHPVTAYLPSNPTPVTYSINSGTPIATAEPHHPISVVLNKLGELSCNRWQEKAAGAADGPKAKPVKGFGIKMTGK